MLKFYFNTMTKTRFTLKYSRIHSVQACGSKVEWKTKAKFLYKGLAFPFSPLPFPWKFLYFSPHLVSNPGKLYYNSRQYLFFYKCCLSEQKADVTLLQQISKRRHYFPEAHMLFRSNLDSGLKRKWYVYILFGFLQKKGVFGVKKKKCVHQDQPQLYNLLCFIQQSQRSPSEEGCADTWEAGPVSQTQAGGS